MLFFGIVCLFRFNFYFGFILSFLGLFGVNSSKSESQFFKIENILKFSKVSELKLKPLQKIEFDSNLSEFNTIGLTASASAPEEQLNLFIDQIKKVYAIEVLNFKEDENITFKIPNFLN